MLTSETVRTVTYKADLYGPNISKAEAIANSDAWEAVEPDMAAATAALDELPSAEWDEEPPPPPTPSSDAGSSASHAATPPTAGRGRGRGRGRA